MRDWLRNKRLEKQLTQAQLAETVGADATMISKIEVGDRRPSVELAKKIAEALGFDWTRFYE